MIHIPEGAAACSDGFMAGFVCVQMFVYFFRNMTDTGLNGAVMGGGIGDKGCSGRRGVRRPGETGRQGFLKVTGCKSRHSCVTSATSALFDGPGMKNRRKCTC